MRPTKVRRSVPPDKQPGDVLQLEEIGEKPAEGQQPVRRRHAQIGGAFEPLDGEEDPQREEVAGDDQHLQVAPVAPPLQHGVREAAQTRHEDHEAEHLHRLDHGVAEDPALVEVAELDPQGAQEVAGVADGAAERQQEVRRQDEEVHRHVEERPAHGEAVEAAEPARDGSAGHHHHSQEEDGVEEDEEQLLRAGLRRNRAGCWKQRPLSKAKKLNALKISSFPSQENFQV